MSHLTARHRQRKDAGMVHSTKARPFLRWVGGKAQLLPELLARVPAKFGRYIEPFVGGGALFFALQPKTAYLSDANAELIRTYRAIRGEVESVIATLQGYAIDHSAQLYASTRALDPGRLSDYECAARMIYLNKTCFNGLYRVSRAGVFNVSLGKFKTPPTICDAENLRACSYALQRAGLRIEDFRHAIDAAMPGDFVYLDPPYAPVSKTSNFTSYTAAGFDPRDQAELLERMIYMKRRGVHFLLSNSAESKTCEEYAKAGFKVEQVTARRSVNCKCDKRGSVLEVLVSP